MLINSKRKKHASYPCKKDIADIFFKAGYIETWGRGTNKIVEACKTAGLPEPEFVEHPGGIQTIFLKDIYTEGYLKKIGISYRQINAIKFIKEHGFITNTILQGINSQGKSATTILLQDLVSKNLIKQEGKSGRAANGPNWPGNGRRLPNLLKLSLLLIIVRMLPPILWR